MLIAIADVLTPSEVAEIVAVMGRARLDEGHKTAGFAARLVKNNQQAAGDDRALLPARTLIAQRLMANALFSMAARPKALTPLLFSRYTAGMHYGRHIDDALMGGLRADLSFTLFLSDPRGYEGGELVIESTGGDEEFKLAAGSLVLYPATALHRVADVASGERLAAVGWVRSHIRDAAQRELLFDLDTARRRLFDAHGKTEDFDLVSKSFANLMRMWAED